MRGRLSPHNFEIALAFISELHVARTTDQVVTAAKRYLLVWVDQLHRVPEECRPFAVHNADDVVRAASILEESRRPDHSNFSVGYELNVTADFFTAAAGRIKQLREAANSLPTSNSRTDG
jgi:hypothetical protein